MKNIKVITVFGTRPEAIKMAPVVDLLKKDTRFDLTVCVTGQHREMLDQVLDLFNICPDIDLSVMKKNQSIASVVSEITENLVQILEHYRPDVVLVHGDTATTLGAALATYFTKVKLAHVEAGLRTNDIYSPWPEEGNRKLTSCVTSYHFAPTEQAKQNLTVEGYPSEKIWVTGNTVIDALKMTVDKIDNSNDLREQMLRHFQKLGIDFEKKIILCTVHRRENFGKPFENIFQAFLQSASESPETQFVYPVHPNPNVKDVAYSFLEGVQNIKLIPPQDYVPFVYLMQNCYIIVTDSGGLQEEAPYFGKPVLLLRDTSERPEAVSAGTVKLVGTESGSILKNIQRLLNDDEYYKGFGKAINPYGNGDSALKIKTVLLENEGSGQ